MGPHEPASVSVCRRDATRPGSDPLRTLVWLRGEHECATRAHLSATLARAALLDDADVITDLSGITFMDASTIGAIVDAHNRLRAHARSLSIRDPSRLARRLLDVCGLTFLIERPAAVQTVAPALDSWVAVPASARHTESTPPTGGPVPVVQQPARPAASRRAGQAESVPQGRTPS